MNSVTPAPENAAMRAPLQKPAPSITSIDPDIVELVGGLSAEGRTLLIGLLGELFNVLDNMDAFCELKERACGESTSFNRLRQLLTQLNRQ